MRLPVAWYFARKPFKRRLIGVAYHDFGICRVEYVLEVGRAHVDMDCADRAAIGERREVNREVFDGVIGQQRDPVAPAYAVCCMVPPDPVGDVEQLAVVNALVFVQRADGKLVRYIARVTREPVEDSCVVRRGIPHLPISSACTDRFDLAAVCYAGVNRL